MRLKRVALWGAGCLVVLAMIGGEDDRAVRSTDATAAPRTLERDVFGPVSASDGLTSRSTEMEHRVALTESEATPQLNTSTAPTASGLIEPDKAKAVTAPKAPKAFRYVTGSRVNLRSAATLQGEVLTQLSRGEKALLLGPDAESWTKISTLDGRFEGWMSSRYLSTLPIAPERPAQKRTVAPPTSREIAAAQRAIIQQSIASYPGSCPCPYSVNRGGRRCGGTSAWSRPGGYAPLCYDSDISQARLDSYFARRRGATE